MNQVSIIGRLAADPELKTTPNDNKVCELRLAVNHHKRPDEADFFNVQTWGPVAESCAEYLTKGRQVAVDGRLASDQWQAEDGTNRSRIYVVARSVDFLSRPSTDDSEGTDSKDE